MTQTIPTYSPISGVGLSHSSSILSLVWSGLVSRIHSQPKASLGRGLRSDSSPYTYYNSSSVELGVAQPEVASWVLLLEVQSAARSLDHWYVDPFSISWCSTVLTPSTKYSPGCSRAVVHSHSVLLQRADDGGFSTNKPTNSSSSSSSSSRVLGVVITRRSQRALLLALAQYKNLDLLVMKIH